MLNVRQKLSNERLLPETLLAKIKVAGETFNLNRITKIHVKVFVKLFEK